MLLFLEKTICEQERIIDTKKAYLDAFVKGYKKRNGQTRIPPTQLERAVNRILDEKLGVFQDRDRLLGPQASVPIYYLLFRCAIEQESLEKITRVELRNFARKVRENRRLAEEDITKADFDLLQFNRFSIQGTNNASSIKERLRIIIEHLGLSTPSFS